MDELHLQIAERNIQKEINAGIARIERYKGDSNEFCEICGDSIPEQRRVALKGVKTCFDCQDKIERDRK